MNSKGITMSNRVINKELDIIDLSKIDNPTMPTIKNDGSKIAIKEENNNSEPNLFALACIISFTLSSEPKR